MGSPWADAAISGVGPSLGIEVGLLVGSRVGSTVGSLVGSSVGLVVGGYVPSHVSTTRPHGSGPIISHVTVPRQKPEGQITLGVKFFVVYGISNRVVTSSPLLTAPIHKMSMPL